MGCPPSRIIPLTIRCIQRNVPAAGFRSCDKSAHKSEFRERSFDHLGCLKGSRDSCPQSPECRCRFIGVLFFLETVVIEVHSLLFVPQVLVDQLLSALSTTVPC